LKMHAYRDAIRRSVGSYILYPGLPSVKAESKTYNRYHEILPGLGAFRLRPTSGGLSEGATELKTFIGDVFEHFASVISQDRRGRYWESVVYSPTAPGESQLEWNPVTLKPPADTIVLLGYVRPGQLPWILEHQLYNLRADHRRGAVELNGPELAADLVVLYGSGIEAPELWTLVGRPEVWSRQRMLEMGYLRPGSDFYICLPLGQRLSTGRLPSAASIGTLREARRPGSVIGTPFTSTVSDLVALVEPDPTA
jgi:hypothetical protein